MNAQPNARDTVDLDGSFDDSHDPHDPYDWRQRGATSRTASTRTAGSGASELESVAAGGQGSTMLTGDSKALAAV